MASKTDIEHFVASDGWQYADMADFLLGKKEWCEHNIARNEKAKLGFGPFVISKSLNIDFAALAAAPVGGIVMFDPNTPTPAFVIGANATAQVPSFSVLLP